MSHVKVSVTLEPDVAEELRQVAGARGLSSFVNRAAVSSPSSAKHVSCCIPRGENGSRTR